MREIARNIIVWTSAAVMIYYGGNKIGDAEWLSRLGLLGGWPETARAVAGFLPWLEVGLGFLLISDGAVGRGARRLTAALLFGFLPFLVYFLLSGMTDCGCAGAGGGGGVVSHPAFGIVRNLALGLGLLWAERCVVWPISAFDRSPAVRHNSGR